ncbi:MAG TPA: ATP-dependent helicase [Candidatus Manganitrophaceae bacterium]|nr:ATP-dependent helicase [Candidatus Manganitrophaceae bacterium]
MLEALNLERLNPEQKEVALSRGGPLLVLAGPGTGKTHTIATRIAALVQEGEDPEKILGITFTNRGAQEMRDRILFLTGKRLSWIRTIHGACAQILRLHIHKLAGHHGAFNIASTEQSNKILKETIRELGLNETTLDLAQLASRIGRLKAQANPAESLLQEAGEFVKIFNLYQDRMRLQGCIDFNDLIFLTLRLFTEDPTVLSEVRAIWSHLIVDEFQDCDLAQYHLISLLGKDRGIVVVGDDDQSIYSFRSATPDVLKHFVADFSPKVITLSATFRLPRSVVAAAASLIKNNFGRFQKDLCAVRAEEGIIEIRGFGSEIEEGEFVAREIQTQLQRGVPAEEIAILARRHVQLAQAEGALNRLNIPCRKAGDRSFYDHREVRDMVALITAVALPENTAAYERVLKLESGISGRVADLLEDLAEREGISLNHAAEMAVENEYIQGETREGLLRLFERMARLRSRMAELCISDLMRAAAVEFNYVGYLQKFCRGKEDFNRRIGYLRELAAMADQFEVSAGPNLINFLNEMAISAIQGGVPKEKKGIRLITLHGAKGLEFRVVFVIGVLQGTLPHVKGQIEEERRLMYVGLTRAKDRVYITHSRYVQNEVREPSFFIHEMGRIINPKIKPR